MDSNSTSKRQNILIAALAVVLLGSLFWYFKYYKTPASGSSEDGSPVATTTAETGASAEKSSPSGTASKSSGYPKYDVDGATLVFYDNSGFHPKNLQVPEKTTVRFVNRSSKAMRIFAVDRSISKYTSLDQSSSVSKGKYYDYVFLGKGVWAYNNKNYPSDEGSVMVF